jgi:hypothetical protein
MSSEVAKALEIPKIYMPMLTTLSFSAVSSSIWVLDYLLTLDAPNITAFELTLGKEPLKRMSGGREAIRQLVNYIATTDPFGATMKPKPLFPSLKDLNYSSQGNHSQEDLETLLLGYPQIKSLVLPKCSTLHSLIYLAPELVQLTVRVKDANELRDLLIKRREAGIPLKVVRGILSTNQNVKPSNMTLRELEGLVSFSLVDQARIS